MKIQKRTLIITLIAVAFIIFMGAIVLAVNSQKLKPHTNVAFYGLNDMQKKAIITELSEVTGNKGKKILYNFTELNDALPVAPQLKGKYDILFTLFGKNEEQVLAATPEKKEEKVALASTILDGTTISVHQKAVITKSGNIAAVPLLLDHCEIDIDRSVLKQCGIKTIASWLDIEKFAVAAQKYIPQPVVFAGGDSDSFLGMMGALTESLSGKKAYDDAVAAIQQKLYNRDKKAPELTVNDYDELIASLAESDDAPLHNAVQLLLRWQRLGLLHSEVFQMTNADVLAFMDAKIAAVTFMTLTEHRTVEHETIERYSSIYYPSERTATLRSFSAPVIAAIPRSTEKNTELTIAHLIAPSVQESLSRGCGLAPVQANCHVADHQADDVRYWIAATNAPLAPLGQAAFTDRSTRDTFSKQLGAYIKYYVQR